MIARRSPPPSSAKPSLIASLSRSRLSLPAVAAQGNPRGIIDNRHPLTRPIVAILPTLTATTEHNGAQDYDAELTDPQIKTVDPQMTQMDTDEIRNSGTIETVYWSGPAFSSVSSVDGYLFSI